MGADTRQRDSKMGKRNRRISYCCYKETFPRRGQIGGDNTKQNSYAKGFQDWRMSVIQEAKDIINKDVAGIYSAIFMNLHDRYGFGYERLNRLAEETLKLWDEFPGDPIYIINECESRQALAF